MEKTLADLSVKESGIITKIDLDEQKHFKTLHLGVLEGNKITSLFESPFKDPVAYQIHGCIFALRKEDARKIMVKTYE